jgi:hypothetical protein
MVFNISNKLTLTVGKTCLMQFDINVEICIPLNIGYDNKMIEGSCHLTCNLTLWILTPWFCFFFY